MRSVRILGRHHFASALQRMSTVADVEGANGGGVARHCLVKGSPEALKPLLACVRVVRGIVPWFGREGMRVLALASKVVDAADAADAPSRPRSGWSRPDVPWVHRLRLQDAIGLADGGDGAARVGGGR